MGTNGLFQHSQKESQTHRGGYPRNRWIELGSINLCKSGQRFEKLLKKREKGVLKNVEREATDG